MDPLRYHILLDPPSANPLANASTAALLRCHVDPPGTPVFAVFVVTSVVTSVVLLLPVYAAVVYLGVRRWRRSSAPSSSSSDVFTYHMVAMEMVGLLGGALCCWGFYLEEGGVLRGGVVMMSLIWYGQMMFHLLTCAERHLAVVHPVAYRGLRSRRGVRLRNVAVVTVWLLSSGAVALMEQRRASVVLDCLLVTLTLGAASFCSVSVLRALARRGPGEQGGAAGRRDQSKGRALAAIGAILATLVLRFAWNLAWAAQAVTRGGGDDCAMLTYGYWVNLPSSLVLPSLYLHRAGKLSCRRSHASA